MKYITINRKFDETPFRQSTVSVSLSGCGFLGVYLVGALQLLSEKRFDYSSSRNNTNIIFYNGLSYCEGQEGH